MRNGEGRNSSEAGVRDCAADLPGSSHPQRCEFLLAALKGYRPTNRPFPMGRCVRHHSLWRVCAGGAGAGGERKGPVRAARFGARRSTNLSVFSVLAQRPSTTDVRGRPLPPPQGGLQVGSVPRQSPCRPRDHISHALAASPPPTCSPVRGLAFRPSGGVDWLYTRRRLRGSSRQPPVRAPVNGCARRWATGGTPLRGGFCTAHPGASMRRRK